MTTYLESQSPDHLAWAVGRRGIYWRCLCGLHDTRDVLEKHMQEVGRG